MWHLLKDWSHCQLYIYYKSDVTQAIKEGVDAVIAVGGDGTLHEVQLPSLSYYI